MAWKQLGAKGNKYLKFEAGAIFEGVYEGYRERDNPFYDPTNPMSKKITFDYTLNIGDEKKVLSSPAQSLMDKLKVLTPPIDVRIECVQKGGKKWYQVYTRES